MTGGESGLLVVPAAAGDAGSLARLHAASFAEDWDEAALRRLLEAPASRGFLLTRDYDRRPIGFVIAFLAVDEAEIITIAVDPACRRLGAGGKLMHALIEELQREGAASLFLEVAADNGPALGLYRGLGFEQAGIRGGYYRRADGPSADALMLKLDLSRLARDGRSQAPSL